MSTDDPTLPGRPTRLRTSSGTTAVPSAPTTAITPSAPHPYRTRAPSARTMRVVTNLRARLAEALTKDGALQEHALETVIEAAIDAGANVSAIQLDALRQQVTDLQGKNADLEQTVIFKDEKIARLERALEQANTRIARLAQKER